MAKIFDGKLDVTVTNEQGEDLHAEFTRDYYGDFDVIRIDKPLPGVKTNWRVVNLDPRSVARHFLLSYREIRPQSAHSAWIVSPSATLVITGITLKSENQLLGVFANPNAKSDIADFTGVLPDLRAYADVFSNNSGEPVGLIIEFRRPE